MLQRAYRSFFGLRCSYRREQWALCGPRGVDSRENCWVVIMYGSSDNHPKQNVFNPCKPDEENNASCFLHFISNSSVILSVCFFLRGFLDRQLIITEKKFNRHYRKLILVEKFFHHVPFSLILKLLIYYIFVFETNVEGSWMVLFMTSRRIR